MAPILGPLTDPARHGGDAADAFDVVLVSLPGVAFSGPLTTPGTNHAVAADLEAKLMTKLGYGRFGAQGSDIGALVTAQLGIRHADRLIGLHLHAPVSGQAPYLMTDGQLAYGPGEEACEAQALAFLREGSAYLYTLRTRPQTLGFAMHNSPTGLAAWLIDARRAASRCEGDPGVTFSRDALITNAMLYWLTDTFITSAGYFYGARHGRPPPLQPSARESAPPAAVLQFLDDVLPCPRDWAERHFNLQRWRHVEGGPRVGPLEASGALITDLRDFFRPLRGRRVNQSPGRDA
jgi:pimeloyl-ACP methyl ester carboxylesterase